MDLKSYLTVKYERECQRESNGSLGHILNRFPLLSKSLNGIQAGLYLIGAETNIGKTALLTNLFLDLLQSNDSTKGIYFSFDDCKDTIINRLLAILTALDINQVQVPKSLSPSLGKILMDIGYDCLKKLAGLDRLIIYDMNDINSMEDIIATIEKNKHDNLIVCIDGIYNLPSNTASASLREDTIIRANALKALTDTYKIPILVSVEVRKKEPKNASETGPSIHDIMETGKFGYNAHVVIMLHPEQLSEFKEKNDPYVMLSVEKNKLSTFKGVLRVRFLKAKGYMVCEKIQNNFVDIFKAVSAATHYASKNIPYQY